MVSCLATPDPTSPHPARQRRKAERPQQLLEAAMSLFISKGLAGTRTEDVAQLAGVSKGTLYRYYASKEDLFKAVVRNLLSEVIAEGIERVDQWEGPTGDLLKLLAHTWWTRIEESRASGIFKLIIAEVGNLPELAQFYVDEVIEPTHRLLSVAINRGMERGEFRRMDVTSVVHALMASGQFLVLFPQCTAACTHNPVPLDSDQFMNTQIELLLLGLQVRPSDTQKDSA
ncbi:MAG TPA: TetR/AcrR family transcriptional regulator [Aquabacterium sp.]|nr:TetR/AcrR family transcriptional regulator [Aquabacterium sp.]HRH28382.1 TetR/AcrR family transcriptional regulator [Aquabacterium sp.]